MGNQNRLETRDSDRCPLTGTEGHGLRNRSGRELAEAYKIHFGNDLPEALVSRYFGKDVKEYQSSASGLRWFSPAAIAGEEFYQMLSSTYPWYYAPSTWDKHYALKLLKNQKIQNFVEVGCGDGIFLEMANSIGISGLGVETNGEALAAVSAKGLRAVLPDSFEKPANGVEALVMLQVLEHVPDPLGFMRHYVELCRPKQLVIAVPCHETLLAHVSDPLAWPPHHVTMWSEQAFHCLGELIDYKVSHSAYPPMTYLRFVQLFSHEKGGKSPLGSLRKRRVDKDGNPHSQTEDLVARCIQKMAS